MQKISIERAFAVAGATLCGGQAALMAFQSGNDTVFSTIVCGALSSLVGGMIGTAKAYGSNQNQTLVFFKYAALGMMIGCTGTVGLGAGIGVIIGYKIGGEFVGRPCEAMIQKRLHTRSTLGEPKP